MSKKALQVLLGSQIVGYHPILAKISGGAAEGVLLSQFLYWEQRMVNARGADWDGWFWKVANELYEETGMTRVEFQTARANLIKRGFIEYEARGVPMRAHYRINMDSIAAALESANEFAKRHAHKFLGKGQALQPEANADQPPDVKAQFVQNGHVHNGHVENEQASLSIMDKLECPKSANQNVQNRQTIHKNTSIDFQKNPRNIAAPSAAAQNPSPSNAESPLPPNIFNLYENLGLLINPTIAEMLKEAETSYPPDWIAEAFKRAAAQNKRNWRYIEAILKNWHAAGAMDDPNKTKAEPVSSSASPPVVIQQTRDGKKNIPRAGGGFDMSPEAQAARLVEWKKARLAGGMDTRGL